MSKEKNRDGGSAQRSRTSVDMGEPLRKVRDARAETGFMPKGFVSCSKEKNPRSQRGAYETGKMYNPCSRHVGGWFSARQSTAFPHSVWKGEKDHRVFFFAFSQKVECLNPFFDATP